MNRHLKRHPLIKSTTLILSALLLAAAVLFPMASIPAFAAKKPPKAPKLKYIDWVSYSKLSIRFTRVKGADGYIIYRSNPEDPKEEVLEEIPEENTEETPDELPASMPDKEMTAETVASSFEQQATDETTGENDLIKDPSIDITTESGNTDPSNQTDETAIIKRKYKRIKKNKGNKNLRAIISANRNKICYYRVRAYKKTKKGKLILGNASNELANVTYKDSPLGELFPKGLPKTKKQMKKYLTWVKVPYYSHGKKKYMHLRVHKKLKKKIKACFKEMYKIKFPVKPAESDSYKWRKMRTSKLRSHHSYGCVVDINWDDNPMATLSEVGHCEYKPGKNRYSIRKKVVKIWKKHGFYWGGDWTEKKDYMHLTYTNN